MCNKTILSLILKFRNRDKDAFMIIYKVFERLILHYNKKMCCEDGVSELTLFLMELLYRLDLSQFEADESFGVQKYIAVALRNRFIDVSKKCCEHKRKTQPLTEVVFNLDECCDEKIMLPEVLSRLSNKQKLVLEYKYFQGYNDVEIARMMGTTRQAVNGIKLRAFNIIKNFYE